jgi:hypothetical protein
LNVGPRELVKEIVLRHIKERPRRISLKLHWGEERSVITIEGDAKRVIEIPQAIDFASFGYGTVDAFREAYGDLEVVPISFREEAYRNDRVLLLLHPTGSAGVFDIFVEYRERWAG